MTIQSLVMRVQQDLDQVKSLPVILGEKEITVFLIMHEINYNDYTLQCFVNVTIQQ